MRAAVVRIEDRVVINVIVADAATDVAPDGCYLVNNESFFDIGWVHNPVMNDFVNPNPEEDAG